VAHPTLEDTVGGGALQIMITGNMVFSDRDRPDSEKVERISNELQKFTTGATTIPR
jgi:hypothetical protein